MIIRTILIIVFILLPSLFMYLIIVGGNMNKSDKEIEFEKEEQIKIIDENRRK